MPVDEDTRNLIIAGDLDMVAEVFAAIDSLEKKVNGTPSEQSQYRREEVQDPKERVKEGVDILTMDATKDPRKAESSLEMILITLCAAFNMKPKQSAALLTNNNEYLLHSVVKGLKGKFEPVQGWFKMLYNLTDDFENIIDMENQVHENSKTLLMVLNTFKTGFFSHNSDVVLLCCRVMNKFGKALVEGNLQKPAYDWFSNI